MATSLPKRLFKYRALTHQTLDMIVSDEVYFADPSTFNDPLDTRPSLEADVNSDELEVVLRRLVEQRINAEKTAAAKSIRYRGPRTVDRIERLSRWQADRLLKDIEYHASNPEYGGEKHKQFLLRHSIEAELLRQYETGIVSLAERSRCPLMWSHYGDQHRGICIGYSVPDRVADNIHKVKYRGGRLVQVGKLAAMLEGSETARREVDEAVLLRKAGSWHYEREWRLIGPLGLARSPLEMEEIIFGLRCKDSTKYAVMKTLEGREHEIKFYEMHEVPGTFRLKKRVLHYDDDLFVGYPVRAVSMYEDFADILESDTLKGLERDQAD